MTAAPAAASRRTRECSRESPDRLQAGGPSRTIARMEGRGRLRDLGITLGLLPTGPRNAISDVDDVRVGHCSVIAGEAVRTGVTAILPHGGNPFARKCVAAAHVVNGFGKSVGLPQIDELGQLETPILLTNTLNVGRVADALIAWALERNAADGIEALSINAVVGECNDGYLNDIAGRHVREEHVRAALAEARVEVVEGSVGAGVGMSCYGYKGGIGTASRLLPPPLGGWTLGALVLANFGRPGDLVIAGVPVGARLLGQAPAPPPQPPGSIMMILATDAPVDARQLGRIARRAVAGLARTGSHLGHGSGDFVIAFTTANPVPHAGPALRTVRVLADDSAALDALFRAAAESVEEAILNALCAAATVVGRAGHRREALPLEKVRALLGAREG